MSVVREEKDRGQEEREQEMEDTGDDNVDPREWSSENVTTFVRSLGTSECFQSAGDQVLQFGVDVGVFFTLSLNDFQGICGHARAYDHMCEFTHNSTDARVSTMTQTDHSCTLSNSTTVVCTVVVCLCHCGTDRPKLYYYITMQSLQ